MTQNASALARPLTALVTGASGGIGEVIARQLAASGHNLILVARSTDRLQALADELGRQHGTVGTVIPLDLSHAGAPAQLEEAVKSRGLQVDLLVNNAGFASYGAFQDLDLTDEMEMIQVNVGALTELTRRFLPGMVERRRGYVLNVASTAAFMPGPYMAVYYASKAFVLSFSEALAEELRGSGVQVTALCPGPVLTGFQDRAQMGGSRLMNVIRRQAVPPEVVARQGLQALFGGRPVVVVGAANVIQTLLFRFLPRGVVTRVMKQVQGAQR